MDEFQKIASIEPPEKRSATGWDVTRVTFENGVVRYVYDEELKVLRMEDQMLRADFTKKQMQMVQQYKEYVRAAHQEDMDSAERGY